MPEALPQARAPRLGLALALVAALSCTACTPSEGTQRRSIILVSIDTLRADHLSLHGYGRETSPYLERLAQESMVFEQAYCSAVWTLPSHMSMLTGLYPRQHGVTDPTVALSPDIPLMAERLQNLGYQTHGFYRTSPLRPAHGFARGFDTFVHHDDAEMAEEHLAEAFAKIDPERPFFIFIHLFDVHCGPLSEGPGPIYHAPDPFARMFLPDAPERIRTTNERQAWDQNELTSREETEALVALYDGGIRYVDHKLESWVEDWRAAGWLEDALVTITSDHGEGLGQRGLLKGHGGPFQEGLRVPLIVRHPDHLGAGQRFPQPVQQIDLVPTMLDYLGLPHDPALPGLSLLGALPARRELLAHAPGYEVLINGPEKWIRTQVRSNQEWAEVNLDEDPGEQNLVARDAAAFEERLRPAYERLRVFPGPIPVGAEDVANRDTLEALGYGGDGAPEHD